MCPVSDGQSVNAAITNPAFLDAQIASTGVGVVTLAATSSTQVDDIQNSINVLIDGVGGNQSTPATSYAGTPSGTITSGSDHQTALIALANKFFGAASAGGHTHDGTDGQGAPINAVTNIAVSGGTLYNGNIYFYGTGQASIADAGGGYFQIDSAVPTLEQVLAAGNNNATAGIDFNGGAIAGLSYLEFIETSTPPAPASGYDRITVHSDGHPYIINSSSAEHRIDTSVAVSGQSALYGDATFTGSSGIALTQSGQNIDVHLNTPVSSVYVGGTRTINSVTGTAYTFALTDGSGYGGNPLAYFTSNSAVTATVPPASSVSWPSGTQIDCERAGSGTVTIAAGAGVTINSKGGKLSVNGQYVGVSLVNTASDVWTLFGDLA